MINPKALIFSGYGLNCEEETRHAFETAGVSGDIVHINDIIEKPILLKNYQIGAMPGGFSFGDDTGSGNAFAEKITNHLEDALREFLGRDTLMIGMCNGFQILAQLGVFGPIALLPNSNARYTTRWVDLSVNTKTPWFTGMSTISLPIAHGEGRLYAEPKEIANLKKTNRIAATYIAGELCEFQSLSKNPNGSTEDIAGVIDTTGRILGLMPHPERAVRFTQLPHWTYLKEKYVRQGENVPKQGPGLQVFQNAINYFK